MTIILPDDYHVRRALEQTRVLCISSGDARRQDIRPLRIGILNVMPKAESYEFSLLQPLGRSIIQIEPVWIRLTTHSYASSNPSHIASWYVPFERAIRDAKLDGLLLTGAPVEEMPYEAVHYWRELLEILEYARREVACTLGICWGGMALARLLGIDKIRLPQKLFGVYKHRNLAQGHPIMGDTDDEFWCPHSRHSTVPDEALESAQRAGVVHLLAHGSETGYTVFESADQRYLMHLGHPEYEPERISFEYDRDRAAGRADVQAPSHFDPSQPVNVWRSHRNEFFAQWIKFIYDAVSLAPRELPSVAPGQNRSSEGG